MVPHVELTKTFLYIWPKMTRRPATGQTSQLTGGWSLTGHLRGAR